MLSQNSIIENYNSGFEGMHTYYGHVSGFVRSNHPQVAIPPPIKVTLNAHNIIKSQKVILDSYRYDEPMSVFKTFEQTPFYSLMHDGISKFGVDYNGDYLRGINSDQEPFFVPYRLSKMKGGVTGLDTAHEIISVNVKDAHLLHVLYGFESPDYRCSAHVSAGTVKRLATSKTMGVPEVSVLYECLRTVIKHFECSVKNKEILNECMELLELTCISYLGAKREWPIF